LSFSAACEARVDFIGIAARLKSCQFKAASFFRSLLILQLDLHHADKLAYGPGLKAWDIDAFSGG
jgi:hypothetical protein